MIEVVEVLSLTIGIEANSKEESLEMVQDNYRKEHIVLGNEHHVNTEFILKYITYD